MRRRQNVVSPRFGSSIDFLHEALDCDFGHVSNACTIILCYFNAWPRRDGKDSLNDCSSDRYV